MLTAKSANSALFSAPASPDRSRAERWLQEQLKRAARMGVFTITAELTPELAELLLADNPDNRPIQHYTKVVALARDITAGAWRHNGETIIVADTGSLNDGQHRCAAVVKSGRSIVTEMSFGLPRDSRETIDTGTKRTAAAHLKMAGCQNATALASSASIVLTIERHGRLVVHGGDRPTIAEIKHFVDAHSGLNDHYAPAQAVHRQLRVSGSMLAALHYLFSQKSEIDANRFFHALASGENLTRDDPIYRLRAAFLTNAVSKAKLPLENLAALTIIAWNLFRKGERRRTLTWRSEGPQAQPFPLPE